MIHGQLLKPLDLQGTPDARLRESVRTLVWCMEDVDVIRWRQQQGHRQRWKVIENYKALKILSHHTYMCYSSQAPIYQCFPSVSYTWKCNVLLYSQTTHKCHYIFNTISQCASLTVAICVSVVLPSSASLSFSFSLIYFILSTRGD